MGYGPDYDSDFVAVWGDELPIVTADQMRKAVEKDSKQIAREKYKDALRLIESAMHLLGDAREQLSPLIWAVEEWELVGKHYNLIHQLWRDVAYSGTQDKVDLDSTNKEALAKGGRV